MEFACACVSTALVVLVGIADRDAQFWTSWVYLIQEHYEKGCCFIVYDKEAYVGQEWDFNTSRA